MKIMTLTGKETELDQAEVEGFISTVRGAVLRQGDRGYDEARVVFNAIIDKRPALIVRCSGVADVIDSVNFAAKHNLLTAVRGGGHNIAGSSICDGGLMIDMQLMKSVQVDPDDRTVEVQSGATLGDIDRDTQAFGLAVPVGMVSKTGIAGLTLGGGFGWIRGKYGLAIDNLLSVDIVTADGQFYRASKNQHQDLFWAVRGGGGNFGVVTSFKFRLHPVGPQVMFCGPMYDAQNAGQIISRWREFMETAPDEFTSIVVMYNIPELPSFPKDLHGKPVIVTAGVYTGPVEEGERFVQPLRELGEPLIDNSGPLPYTVVQSMLDELWPEGKVQCYFKSLLLNLLSDEAIETLVAEFNERPDSGIMFVVQDLRGASARVDAAEKAYGDRSGAYMLEHNGRWTDPQLSERNIAWIRKSWVDFKRFSSGSVYLNHSGFYEEGESQVRTNYGKNYE